MTLHAPRFRSRLLALALLAAACDERDDGDDDAGSEDGSGGDDSVGGSAGTGGSAAADGGGTAGGDAVCQLDPLGETCQGCLADTREACVDAGICADEYASLETCYVSGCYDENGNPADGCCDAREDTFVACLDAQCAGWMACLGE
ncbi:MAG: hypothetical protein U0168_14935 [Nannocystaceae bacterium]